MKFLGSTCVPPLLYLTLTYAWFAPKDTDVGKAAGVGGGNLSDRFSLHILNILTKMYHLYVRLYATPHHRMSAPHKMKKWFFIKSLTHRLIRCENLISHIKRIILYKVKCANFPPKKIISNFFHFLTFTHSLPLTECKLQPASMQRYLQFSAHRNLDRVSLAYR